MELKNKVAWITGGASGLGAATAKRFVQHGCKVMITDLNAELGNEFVKELGQDGFFFKADVTKSAENKAALDALLAKWGKIDILVNSAGVGAFEGMILGDNPNLVEDFRKTININLIGLFDCLALAAKAMTNNEPDEEGECGVIINVSSGFYKSAMPGLGSYGASKAAVAHLTTIAASELGEFGIRVAAIAPGAFDTPILGPDRATNEAFFGLGASFPKRLGKPDEVARLISHIVDNPYINGSTLDILAGSLANNPRMLAALQMGMMQILEQSN